jgi:UDP-N-acetylmuramate dehydrogenase
MPALHLQENQPLASYTTFKTGGPARHFVAVTTVEELKIALALARQNRWPVFILAGGSNLIISSKGFGGLVIKIELVSWRLDLEACQLMADASVPMKTLVDESVAAGLAGLEWAGGLPGTFGGAIRGNAGAFGGEIKDSIESVSAVNATTGQQKTWTAAQCQFGYRDSYFKQHPEEIITAARLKLTPGNQTELRHIADERIAYRQAKHPLEYPNAGSIFKNVPVEQVPKEFMALFEAALKTDPFPIIPTARILDVAGLKGARVGGAEISSKMPNYIVNTGGASGEDIVGLIQKVHAAIQEKYRIGLVVEPELVGF